MKKQSLKEQLEEKEKTIIKLQKQIEELKAKLEKERQLRDDQYSRMSDGYKHQQKIFGIYRARHY